MTLKLAPIVLALAAIAAGQPRPPAPVPVIVELFTSEGCSSCPPADNLLSQIERFQPFRGVEVIALGEHVDYWNQLGWPDRFASSLFTARQEDYGRRFSLESVYTPQMVVNGQVEVLGSDGAAVQREIFKAAQGPRALVEMSILPGEVLTLKVDHLPQGTRQADILLAVTEAGIESDVRRGENRGHTLRHTGVVRSLSHVAFLDTRRAGIYTADARLNLKPDWKRENLKVVLFVQDRSNRRILGAAALRP
jgi:hypothetical protein